MAINLDALSKAELQELERAIAQRERGLEQEHREAALAEARAVVERYGLSLESLVGVARAKKRSNGKGNGKGEGAAPRYRHPENPALTWSGRGRRPRWFLDAVAAGAAPEDLAIDRRSA